MTNFCTNCGTILGSDGVCPNCGMVFASDAAGSETVPGSESGAYAYGGENTYAQPEPSNYAPQPESGKMPDPPSEQPYYPSYQPQSDPVRQPAPSANASARKFDLAAQLKGWLTHARGFFTPEPLRTARQVIAGEDYVWAVFAAINVIVGALCTSAMTGNGLNWVISTVFGTFAGMDSFLEGYSFGALVAIFFFSLLTLAGFTAAAAGIAYGFLLIEKKHLSFMTTLKTVSVAFFPLTLTCVAAFVFSFFLYPMAAVLLLAGILASVSLFNELIQKQAGERNFWVTALCNAAQVVAGIIIVSISISVV